MRTRQNGNVLVLGRGTRAFLSVIRSLGRAGLQVHVGMCEPNDLALKSKYIAAYHSIPAFHGGDSRWVEAMQAILRKTPFQLVIPCNDHAVIPLQIHRDRLLQFSRLCTLSDEAFRRAFDKIETYRLAEELGIPQPTGKVADCRESADAILAGFSFPVVLKPPSSFTAENLGSKRAVVRARTRDEFERHLREARDWGRVLVQENFNGVGVGVELLAQAGKTLLAFQHVRVHEPLEGGGSSYRKSVPLDPQLLAASEALLRALNYTGVAMVEFKHDFETGRWVLIEINGRFWGSLPLALAAGADFPLSLYEMLVHGRTEFSPRYRSGVYCRNVPADLRWLLANLRSDRNDPTLATRPLKAVAGEVLNILALREGWDTLTLDDPRVGLSEGAALLGDAASKISRTLRRRCAGSVPGRRWAARQIISKTRRSRTVLFVCKGNICRSPFAERYAQQVLPSDVEVMSSGFYPVAERRSPDDARAAARKFGVDLDSHRSTIIDESTVAQADVILAFDEHNLEALCRAFPWASRRVFRLAAMHRINPLVISDPYGQGAAMYEAVYRQIVQAIDRLADRLKQARQSRSLGRQFQVREKISAQA